MDLFAQHGVLFEKFSYRSAIKKTPHEAMYGEKPNLSFMKVFGCVAYSFIDSSETK